MSNYTPDTGSVRAAYTRAMRHAFIASSSEHIADFDRWLKAHDAAKWDEGMSAQWKHRPIGNRMVESANPYRKTTESEGK